MVAAVNCWYPVSDCAKEFGGKGGAGNILPVLIYYPKLLSGIQESETLCRIYFLDLITWKIVRVKMWYTYIYYQENLVHEDWRLKIYHILFFSSVFHATKNKNTQQFCIMTLIGIQYRGLLKAEHIIRFLQNSRYSLTHLHSFKHFQQMQAGVNIFLFDPPPQKKLINMFIFIIIIY